MGKDYSLPSQSAAIIHPQENFYISDSDQQYNFFPEQFSTMAVSRVPEQMFYYVNIHPIANRSVPDLADILIVLIKGMQKFLIMGRGVTMNAKECETRVPIICKLSAAYLCRDICIFLPEYLYICAGISAYFCQNICIFLLEYLQYVLEYLLFSG